MPTSLQPRTEVALSIVSILSPFCILTHKEDPAVELFSVGWKPKRGTCYVVIAIPRNWLYCGGLVIAIILVVHTR
ncbi:hypothetical protein TMatcc_005321 [Talaromyces marneffei ATCC 18224]